MSRILNVKLKAGHKKNAYSESFAKSLHPRCKARNYEEEKKVTDSSVKNGKNEVF